MNPDEQKKQAWTKIATGFLLAVAGLIGLFFGKNLKQRFLRISILILSTLSLGAGFYLMIDGTDDLAIGTVGAYKLDRPLIQTMTFPGPEFFRLSLVPLQKQNPSLRRLQYKCPDDSEEFTVFITRFGVYGIPKESVICKDGFELVVYDPQKGFVHQLPL